MKHFWILLFLLISFISIGQSNNFEFRVYDLNKNDIEYLTLIIDDTIFVQENLEGKLKIELEYGSHKIVSKLYGNRLIDTTLSMNSESKIISLKANFIDEALLDEFNKRTFEKIYSNADSLPIIRLNTDKSFFIKSFFHISLVGCYQIEKGTYKIQNDMLILEVKDYECPCFRTPQKIKHTYRFAIKNELIVDLLKYNGYIEKMYLGNGVKEIEGIK